MYWWETSELRTLEVYEHDAAPIYTGLLNADGTKIYRHVKMAPIGFDLSSGALDTIRQS